MICGYGPAIANAVARRFGSAGYPVALVARNSQRISEAVDTLRCDGITARGFVADLGDIVAVRRVIREVREALGPVEILHWNAFSDIEGDLLSTPTDLLMHSLSVRVAGYVAAVQTLQADLESTRGAVLATSGALAFYGPEIDRNGRELGALSVSVAAQHKTTGLLALTLGELGVYVGEVVVNGFVKGSVGASQYHATIDPEDVAEQFWKMFMARDKCSVILGGASFLVGE